MVTWLVELSTFLSERLTQTNKVDDNTLLHSFNSTAIRTWFRNQMFTKPKPASRSWGRTFQMVWCYICSEYSQLTGKMQRLWEANCIIYVHIKLSTNETHSKGCPVGIWLSSSLESVSLWDLRHFCETLQLVYTGK